MSDAVECNTAVFDTANWMRNSLNLLGHKTLNDICIPGSHDAGMSECNYLLGLAGKIIH